jgi:FKBP-type peptidyl-prolyl cis-trans isomerase (trigger factor)
MAGLDNQVASDGEYDSLASYLEANEDVDTEEYVNNLCDSMTDYLKPRLILEAIVKANNITIDDSEYDDFLEYGYETEGADTYDSVDDYERYADESELEYNFKYVYAGLCWLQDNMEITYEES